MKKITVEITEVLKRKVTVEAEDIQEAIAKVEDMYKEEEIVLDSSDFCYMDTFIVDTKEEE